jgi:hypothetical protein
LSYYFSLSICFLNWLPEMNKEYPKQPEETLNVIVLIL